MIRTLYRLLGINRLSREDKELRQLDAEYYRMILEAHDIPSRYYFKDENSCATVVVHEDEVEFPAYWRKDYAEANDSAWDQFFALRDKYKLEAA